MKLLRKIFKNILLREPPQVKTMRQRKGLSKSNDSKASVRGELCLQTCGPYKKQKKYKSILPFASSLKS